MILSLSLVFFSRETVEANIFSETNGAVHKRQANMLRRG